jgi:hypothetical protein
MANKKNTKLTVVNSVVKSAAEMIQLTDAKIKTYRHISDSSYKTSMNLEGFGNLKEEASISTLLKAAHSVKAREEGYNDAADDLGIETYPAFSIGGGSYQDWKADIKLRIQIIEHKETMDKLNEIRKDLEGLMTDEDRKLAIMEKLRQL